MRTIRIRKFMVMGMISVVILPWFVYFLVHFNTTGAGPWDQQKELTPTLNRLAADSHKWYDPAWQSRMRSQLSKERINAEILSPTNQTIFKAGYGHANPWMSNQQATVVENGRVLGTVKLSSRMRNDIAAGLSALTAMILAIFFVGYQMRRSVVKPLEAMSGTARRIAEGDLDINLPVSRVTEIAEVRTGFEVMVAGLQDSFQKQAKLEEERRFFIGAIAHDLRTPLFALRGYLDGLEQGIAATPEKVAKYVRVCKEKSDQLDRLVSDLFAFTKLEYIEQPIHYEQIDMSDLLERSADSLRPLSEEKGIAIALVPPSDPCGVRGDAHLLERAINNLLDNAIRHTPAGGKIVLHWYQDNGKTVISVEDSGPGFTPEDLVHVFEPLYRGEVSRNRATGGAGLGLTIAKRIFNAHGGDLEAANSPKGGAVLTGWIDCILVGARC